MRTPLPLVALLVVAGHATALVSAQAQDETRSARSRLTTAAMSPATLVYAVDRGAETSVDSLERTRDGAAWRLLERQRGLTTELHFDSTFRLTSYRHAAGARTSVELTSRDDRLRGFGAAADAERRPIDVAWRAYAGPRLFSLMMLELLPALPAGTVRLPTLDVASGAIAAREYVSAGTELLATPLGRIAAVRFDDATTGARLWLREAAPHLLVRLDVPNGETIGGHAGDGALPATYRLVSALGLTIAADAPAPADAPRSERRRETAAYELVAPTDAELDRVAPAVERALATYAQLFAASAPPVAVALYESEAQRLAYDDASFRARGRTVLRWPARTDGAPTDARTIAHELLHHLVRQRYPALPAWLDEGMAQFAESAGDLTDVAAPLRAYRGRYLPLAALFGAEHPASSGDVASGSGSTVRITQRVADPDAVRRAALFYPQSFAVLRYLADREGPAAVGAVVASVARGGDVETALAPLPHVPHTLAALDADWRRWLDAALRPR